MIAVKPGFIDWEWRRLPTARNCKESVGQRRDLAITEEP
jgi:hypothetical protein